MQSANARCYKTITLQKHMSGITQTPSTAKGGGVDDEQDQEDASLDGDEDTEAVEPQEGTALHQLFATRHALRIIYEQIAERGERGITLQEMRNANLPILISLLRRHMKMLITSGHVSWVTDQAGRQHVKRYFVKGAKVVQKVTETAHAKLLVKSEVESRPSSSMSDSSSVQITQSKFSDSLVASFRKDKIEQSLMDRKALLLSELAAGLRTVDDKKQGCVDRRTVLRLCNELVKENRIGMLIKPLKSGKETTKVFTMFGVDPEDEVVKNAVARRDRCAKPVAVPVADDTELICGPLRIRRVNNGRVALLYPKMQRCEMLHSFLWYLLYGEGKTNELTGHLGVCGKNIGTMNTFENLPPGWLRLGVAVDAMPLYLLAVICPVALAILPPSAVEAAINSGLTFSQLAPDLRASALHTWGSFSLAGELREQILILNALGLVTFLERRSHSTSHLRTCIYVHKATPVVPLKNLPKLKSRSENIKQDGTALECFEAVATFWSDLRNESLHTPSCKKMPISKSPDGKAVEKTKKSRLAELCKFSLNVPTFEDVPEFRNATLGNQLGPGGVDSRVRLTLNTMWNNCKWSMVPRLDDQSHDSLLSSRRRTKLMALAGNYRRRRRNLRRSGSPSMDETRQPKSKVARLVSISSLDENTRKRSGGDRVVFESIVKKKKIRSKSNKASEQQPQKRRRRAPKQQSVVTQQDDGVVIDDTSGKLYKTLQTLIDSLVAYDAYYSSENPNLQEKPKPLATKDVGTLGVCIMNSCVSVAASHARLQSFSTPSFQDVRRAVVFPSLEVAVRSWVSHAYDLIIQLYPNLKKTGLVFQFILSATQYLLNDKTAAQVAQQPENNSAMKKLWEIIYSLLQQEEFIEKTLKNVHHVGNLEELENSNRLVALDDFWGVNGYDIWSRMGVFLPFSLDEGRPENEEQNRIRSCIGEQSMCAFLICTRLSQAPEPESPIGEDGDSSLIREGRAAVYKQLVASDCYVIQRALRRL